MFQKESHKDILETSGKMDFSLSRGNVISDAAKQIAILF